MPSNAHSRPDAPKHQELHGRVAIVSGGAGAIGSATARLLAQAGAQVVIADLPASPMHEVAAALRAEGLAVQAHALDLSDEASIQALMADTAAQHGRIDILDNNAAMKGLSADRDVMAMDAAVWDAVMGCNARGTMLMCKYALPSMIAGGGGSIINISSGTSQAGDFLHTAYAVSKGAINTLTRYVATQYGNQGVRCNALLIGSVVTPAMQRALTPAVQAQMATFKAVGRLGQPEDVADMVAFLASDRSRWITGQTWGVDGGFFAQLPTTPAFQALRAQAAAVAPPPANT
jgi:NAD(P)-dependent dehydrogenase (short-subunit alcohol dehydrogenase family)